MGPRRDPRPAREHRRRRLPSTLRGMETPGDRVWEVFRQESEGDPMIHGGNVRAPDEELALHYAREFYGRRQESHRLWVVPREAIVELDDPDLLQPPFDRSFKRPAATSSSTSWRRREARRQPDDGDRPIVDRGTASLSPSDP